MKVMAVQMELVKQLDDNALVLDALKNGPALVAAGTGWPG
jgi:hypothetical protein